MQHTLKLCLGIGLALCGIQASVAQSGNTAPACAEPVTINNPYKGVFYANDFSFIDSPCLASGDPRDAYTKATDRFKRMAFGDGGYVDLGGEFRMRFHDENDHGLTRLNGLDNSFLLTRLRLYANVNFNDNFRIYAEAVDARIHGNELPARGIERDRFDILNGFAEIRGTVGEGRGYIRAGRQELLFGRQRLISPLEWGNTRRTFDGFRGGYTQNGLSIDVFSAMPRVVDPTGLNDWFEDNFIFSGGYATYSGLENQNYDFYVLNADNDAGQFNIWTIGHRGDGKAGQIMWEYEGALQFGDHTGRDQKAAMVTAGLGYSFGPEVPWKPVAWFYYDYASGDGDPTDGERKTFFQHFPLAHAYLGFMDLVGRQNVSALSLRINTVPHKKLRFNIGLHDFNLAKAVDGLYNAGGGIIRQDATGAAGKDIGKEVDFVLAVPFHPRANVLFGYSRFWGGDLVDATNPAGIDGNANFFYIQGLFRF